jgi:hypothetical protein
LRCERVSVVVVLPAVLPSIVVYLEEGVMAAAVVTAIGRAIGLDVHLDFCEIAICDEGKVRSAGRVKSSPEDLKILAESLLPTVGWCWR